MCRLYANTLPFYIRDLGIWGFGYLQGGGGPGSNLPLDAEGKLYSEVLNSLKLLL